MLTQSAQISFEDAGLVATLEQLPPAIFDSLRFGVIGFGLDGVVCKYSQQESLWAGLSVKSVIGTRMFETVAPCMNNFLVAQRFEDARVAHKPLDMIIDYVLTLRMRPTPVTLRMLYDPAFATRYVLVNRLL